MRGEKPLIYWIVVTAMSQLVALCYVWRSHELSGPFVVCMTTFNAVAAHQILQNVRKAWQDVRDGLKNGTLTYAYGHKCLMCGNSLRKLGTQSYTCDHCSNNNRQTTET